jgi:drug/metabolite transporter (DMT)-like permease
MIEHPPRLKLISAFAAVYLIWGSTYLGIRIAIESIPPFLMAGSRFILAGTLLYAWTRIRGVPPPTLNHWRSAALIGLMLLVIGNGTLSWAEQVIPSGIAALLVAISPLWFVTIEWMQGGIKPSAGVAIGLVLGTFGIMVLIDPADLVGGEDINILGAIVLLLASMCWAAGSIYSRRATLPSSPMLATGMEMLAGGLALVLVSAISGELNTFHLSAVTNRSFAALAYLTVFGSLIAFTSYVWLLRATTPALASTYAYVNPVVAVLIGWLVADEPLYVRILGAAALIIAAVAAITWLGTRESTQSMKHLHLTESTGGSADRSQQPHDQKPS